jgi:hypothetical protein
MDFEYSKSRDRELCLLFRQCQVIVFCEKLIDI